VPADGKEHPIAMTLGGQRETYQSTANAEGVPVTRRETHPALALHATPASCSGSSASSTSEGDPRCLGGLDRAAGRRAPRGAPVRFFFVARDLRRRLDWQTRSLCVTPLNPERTLTMFDLQSRLSSLTHLGASWVLWTLIGLSILGVAIVLERAVAFLLARDDLERLERELVSLVSAGDLEGARSRAASSRAYESWMVRAGLTAPGDATATEQRMMAAGTKAKLAIGAPARLPGHPRQQRPLPGPARHRRRHRALVPGARRQRRQGQRRPDGRGGRGRWWRPPSASWSALPSVAAFNAFQRVIKVKLARAEALGRNVLAAFRAEGV
jgi:biopolymer transport protein ExbB